MVHSGFEATAVVDAVQHPMKLLGVTRKGVRTDGPMAPEIDLSRQRPADYVFSKHVETMMAEIKASNDRGGRPDAEAAE